MKTANWTGGIVLAILALLCLYTWKVSQPLYSDRLNEQSLHEHNKIAPIAAALTFARLVTGETLLVLASQGSGVIAIDLQAASGREFIDSIDAFQQLGGHALRSMATHSQGAQLYRWERLGIPVEEAYPHIGAGTNYRDHAEEVGHMGDPFVFPKFSRLTPWNADVNNGVRLDYEVELCAVPLTDYSMEAPAMLGYILCGDFTDRWLLIREMDIGGPMGPTGFAVGKGGATRLPVGNLFVIPADEAFYREVEFSLYLNGELRQRASASQMIWTPQQVVEAALDACAEPYYLANALTVVTPSCDFVARGTFLLTGTPGGVMFKIANLWSPFSYLRESDEVVATATYLGFMRNKISATSH